MEMNISDTSQDISPEEEVIIKLECDEFCDETLTNAEELPVIQDLKSEVKCESDPMKVDTDTETSIICEFCGEHWNYQTNHECDTKDLHIKDEMFQCDVCVEVFMSEEDLEDHKAAHHEEESEEGEDEAENAYVCSVCNDIFGNKKDLIEHKISKSECHEHRKCDKCIGESANVFSCIWELIDHAKAQHGLKDEDEEAEYLEHCEAKAAGRPFSNNFHNGQKTFTCDLCSETFSRCYLLDRHKEARCHSARSNPHPCDHCSETFYSVFKKETHERKIHGAIVNLFQCEFCNEAFAYPSVLERHRSVHLCKLYSCTICKKAFSRDTNRIAHERTHTDGKYYSCKFCSKTFASNWVRTQHQKTHADNESYACSFCSRKFDRNGSRKLHERIHTEKKRYSCDLCNVTFGYKHNLNVHQKNHMLENVFKCDFCCMKFARNDLLVQHKTTHIVIEQKSFSCNFCRNTFPNIFDKNIHERTCTIE